MGVIAQTRGFMKKLHYILLTALFILFLCLFLFFKKENTGNKRSIANWGAVSMYPQNLPLAQVMPSQVMPNPAMTVPTGTSLMVPPWIKAQYIQMLNQQEALSTYSAGNLLDFLVSNYSQAAPSTRTEESSTFYLPLLKASYLDEYDSDDNYFSKTEYYDTTSLKFKETKDNNPVLITTRPEQPTKNRAVLGEVRTTPIQSKKPSKAPAPQKDKANQAEVSDSRIQGQPLSYQSQNCQAEDQETEAGAPCADCNNINKDQDLENFISEVSHTVKRQKRAKGRNPFRHLTANFCKSCQPVEFADFFKYVNARAKESRIPPEIFFSIMLQESTGLCGAVAQNRTEGSFGLFQLNTKSPGSTCLKGCRKNISLHFSQDQLKQACINGNYRSSCKRRHRNGVCTSCRNTTQNICLTNPYCNFEESLNLMKRKWQHRNKRKPMPTNKTWMEMNPHERNLWRNAVIAYNGAGYVVQAERAMPRATNKNNWEQKRLYFLKSYLRQPDKRKKNVIHNLAYVERITGREIPCGSKDSIINEWLNYAKKPSSLSCS